jgi:hypothetical protein
MAGAFAGAAPICAIVDGYRQAASVKVTLNQPLILPLLG